MLAPFPSARLNRRSVRHLTLLPALWHLDGPLPRPPHFAVHCRPWNPTESSGAGRTYTGSRQDTAQVRVGFFSEKLRDKASMSLKLASCRDLQQRALTVSTLAAGADAICYPLCFSSFPSSFFACSFSFVFYLFFRALHDRFGSSSGSGCPETEAVLCVAGNSQKCKNRCPNSLYLEAATLVVCGLDLAIVVLSKSDSASPVTPEKENCDAFSFFPALPPISIITTTAATLNERVNFPVTPDNHCSPTPTPLHFAPVPPNFQRHPVCPLDSHGFHDTSTTASANDAGDDHSIGRIVVVGLLLAEHRRGDARHGLG